MNESERDLPSDFGNPKIALLERCEQLQKLFIASLVALLILGISVDYFLIRQMNFIQKDLETVRPQLTLLLANYQKVEDPQIKSFVGALVNYARTHPDFNPILAKYKIPSPSPLPATQLLPTSPVAAPKVAPPVSSKKK